MSAELRVCAPGKVMVLGEYAVLDGAPALVAAVDRGVRCRVGPGAGVYAPGDTRFVDAALAAVQAPPRAYTFEDQHPLDLSSKAGFGGSAAAVCAAVVAGLAAAGRPWAGAVEQAVAVHRAVQGGGSGVDVRACWAGGLRRFEGAASRPLAPVRLRVVWSGASAATGSRVQCYLTLYNRAPFVARSAALVDAFEQDPIGALREARALLVEMAAQAGLEYRTPALDRITHLAEALGGAAKPSGAGGGDIAVALLPDPDAESTFEARCRGEGLLPIPVALSPGVGLEPEAPDA